MATDAAAETQQPETIDDEARLISADPEFTKALEEAGIEAGQGTTPPPATEGGAPGTEAPAAEKPAGGTEAAASPAGPAEPAAWIGDETQELAASYGISPEELREFASAAEFQRALRLIERSMLRPADAPAAAGPAAAKEPSEAEINLDPEHWRAEGYTDETVQLVSVAKQLRDRLNQLEPVVGNFQAMQQQALQQNFVNQFHDALDQMDSSLYGRSADKDGNPADLSETLNENRRKVWEAARVLENGIAATAAQRGQQPVIPPLPTLIKRAEAMVFGDRLVKREQEALSASIRQQATRRRPSSGGGKVSRPEAAAPPSKKADPSIDDEARAIANDPNFLRQLRTLTGE